MHLLFSSIVPASGNPAQVLIENWFSEDSGEGWKYGKHLLLDTKVGGMLEIPYEFDTDCIVVLSTHRSEKEYPTLTVHAPGNWDKAELGGAPRTLNMVWASKMKEVLLGLDEGNRKYGLNWNVNMEVDHHGPTCSAPIMYVEIGSGEKEWVNLTAAKIVAEAVMRMLEADSSFETYFCIGGGHYSQEFTKMGLREEKAAGHILPKYHIETLKMDTFKQGLEKSVDEVKGILIEKKGTNKWQKDIIEALAKEYGTEIEKY